VPNPPRKGEGDRSPQAGDGGAAPGAASLVSAPPPPFVRSPSPFRGGLTVAALWFLFDQVSKWVVTHPLDLANRASIDLLPIFRLIWVENHGVSMGFLVAEPGLQRWLLVALTGGIAIAVAAWLWRERRWPDALALGLILGGALGNILDRVRLGYVADFLNLHFGAWSPFLVFNVADVGVSVGVTYLVLRALFARDAAPSE
jgi:signal peptidase II